MDKIEKVMTNILMHKDILGNLELEKYIKKQCEKYYNGVK